MPDSAAFNTYKNALENTIHDIPHRESHQMSSQEDQNHYQQQSDHRVVAEMAMDLEQTEMYSEQDDVHQVEGILP